MGALAGAAGADEDGGGAASALAAAESLLHGVGGVDPELDALAERLGALAVELGDVAGGLRGYLDRIEADPGRLAAVEERLEAIDRLQRKHGGSVESVLAHAERCRAEIERLEGAETRGAEAEAALAEAEARREKLGKRLSKGRVAAAGPLRERVAEELERLAMPGASLEVELEPHPEGFGPNGRETVELRISPNPGMAPAPLRDAASGGELSRVMLALSGLGAGAGAGTLVFDEIDAGVGGKTARVVGERLRALGEGRQVLCITHLPQVASLASTHFRLEKDVGGERAAATVQRLDGEGVVEEIRRMLGGESADEAPTATPASCSPPPDDAAVVDAAMGGQLPARPPGAVTSHGGYRQSPSLACAAVASQRGVRGEAIHGTARLGRRTKDLVKRLRPGDVAVIDHLNIDRIAAEELIATGVRRGPQRLAVERRPLPERRPAAARPRRHRR